MTWGNQNFQAEIETTVAGCFKFCLGFSDEASQFEYVLSSGFSNFLLDWTLVRALVPSAFKSSVRAPPSQPIMGKPEATQRVRSPCDPPLVYQLLQRRGQSAAPMPHLTMHHTDQWGKKWKLRLQPISLCYSDRVWATLLKCYPWWPAQSCRLCTCERRHHSTLILWSLDHSRIATS